MENVGIDHCLLACKASALPIELIPLKLNKYII